jgi:hypothetical protein
MGYADPINSAGAGYTIRWAPPDHNPTEPLPQGATSLADMFQVLGERIRLEMRFRPEDAVLIELSTLFEPLEQAITGRPIV